MITSDTDNGMNYFNHVKNVSYIVSLIDMHCECLKTEIKVITGHNRL